MFGFLTIKKLPARNSGMVKTRSPIGVGGIPQNIGPQLGIPNLEVILVIHVRKSLETHILRGEKTGHQLMYLECNMTHFSTLYILPCV